MSAQVNHQPLGVKLTFLVNWEGIKCTCYMQDLNLQPQCWQASETVVKLLIPLSHWGPLFKRKKNNMYICRFAIWKNYAFKSSLVLLSVWLLHFICLPSIKITNETVLWPSWYCNFHLLTWELHLNQRQHKFDKKDKIWIEHKIKCFLPSCNSKLNYKNSNNRYS